MSLFAIHHRTCLIQHTCSRKQVRCMNLVQHVYDNMNLSKHEYKNAYATNRIYISSSNNTFFRSKEVIILDEEIFETFVNDFKYAYKKYYNLKEVTIRLPCAIMSGKMLQDLLSIPSSCSELRLNVFAFHSPEPGMWQSCGSNLKKIDIEFTDGLAYPNSATEILHGMESLQSLERLSICNNSPHIQTAIVRSRKLKKKLWYSSGYNVITKKI